jgi:hypothetical protein
MPERELRCKGNKLHGLVVTPATGVIEFRCSSRFCGKEPGVVVLHRFDLETGELETRRYSDPAKLQGR